jgi:response regulator RpfG family c-di-GMP phosphodiesterase
MDAVNEGHIFRFLTKPCAPELLATALNAGIGQYRLITAERELLEQTLRGSIKVLSEMLSLLNPEALGRATRITRYVREIALRMEVADVWQLETAASLSQIGCIMLPEEALKKLYRGQPLAPEESQLFNMHPFIASDLLVSIPRMQKIAEIIAYQEKHFDGSGIPHDARSGKEIPLGARILKVVLDFDTLQAGGMPKNDIVLTLKKRSGYYDIKVLAALEAITEIEEGYGVRDVAAAQLMDGMILAQDVIALDGRLLIARGYQVNKTMHERLKNFAQKPGIKEPIRVLIPLTLRLEASLGKA